VHQVPDDNRLRFGEGGGAGIDDYAFGVANFPVSITMELPAGGTGFNPSTNQIQSFVEETWVGIKAMGQKVVEKY